MVEKKLYILDTSVLLHNTQALYNFDHARVGIPVMVLEELDHIKEEHSFRGHHAREVIRILDDMRVKGHLLDGVPLDNGGILQVLVPEELLSGKKSWTSSPETIDNEIIALAKKYTATYEVTLVSRDINMRVKADALGIDARGYLVDVINEETVYKGYTTINVPSVQLKKELPDDLVARHKEQPFMVNEFIIVQSNNNPYNNKLFRYLGANQFRIIEDLDLKWSLHPHNIQQRMALDLLFDTTVQLVSLIGPAGTGKTFLSLVAALHEVLFYESYERILITRPIIPLGRDIGYLPGAVGEKLHSWMQPIYDNMDCITHSAYAAQRAVGIYHDEEPDYASTQHNQGSPGKNKHKKHHKQTRTGLMPLDELIRLGKVSLEAITYMRGRSIPYQFIIIDESQNLTAHEIKTLISRVGEGSKIVLTGDPYQIDLPTLDFSTNGLVVATERFKGQPLFGTVFLETTERSELSRLAATLL